MADVQGQVRQQLEQFKAQVQEASQAVTSLESLMDQVDQGFTKLEGEVASRTQEIHKLFDELEPLIQDIGAEFDQDWQALVNESDAVVKEFGEDGSTLEQDWQQCASELDAFVAHLDDHDHQVESHVNDVKQQADSVIQKAKDAAHGIVDAEGNAAHTIVDGVQSAAKEVESAIQSTGSGVQQAIGSGIQTLLGHGNDFMHAVQAKSQELGEGLKNEDAQLEAEMQAALSQFESGFEEHLDKLCSEIEQMDHAITAVAGKVGDLTSHGVDAVGTMSQAAESTNVGLNEVVGIVEDVKQILDEVGL